MTETNKESGIKWIVVLLTIGILVLGILAYTKTPSVVNSNGVTSDTSTINMAGKAESKEAPDEAVVYISVQTKHKDVVEAQTQNKEKMNVVINNLKSLGLKDKNLQTDNYNIYQDRQWDYETKKYIDNGYQVSHRLVVTTNDIELVGKVLDTAIKAGANNVDNIQFKLSDKKQKEVELQLLAEATKDAKARAQTLAEAAGMNLGKVLSLGQSTGYTPVYYNDYRKYAVAEMAATAEPTTINPQDVTVMVNVNVVYELE
ncbi:SIMPL domain-containing protein [Candidatus Woesearchaeota archaeon]|nr:SIMPL domain-containing protein [Candidatus Woesearchaeota archaeon]